MSRSRGDQLQSSRNADNHSTSNQHKHKCRTDKRENCDEGPVMINPNGERATCNGHQVESDENPTANQILKLTGRDTMTPYSVLPNHVTCDAKDSEDWATPAKARSRQDGVTVHSLRHNGSHLRIPVTSRAGQQFANSPTTSRPNPEELGAAIEELANALQGAVGQVAVLRQQMKTTCDHAFAVDLAIARAVTALKQLQPPAGPGRGQR